MMSADGFDYGKGGRFMKKKLCALALAVLLLLPGTGTAAMSNAFTDSYTSYGYNAWGDSIEMPDGYVPEQVLYGQDMGTTALSEPADFYIADDGTAYLADAGNNRILKLDGNLRVVQEWTGTVGADGTEYPFSRPTGVYLDSTGTLYVADSGNGRVVKMNMDGHLDRFFLAPDDSDVQTMVEYKPSKVLVDNSGVVYVLVSGLYRGAITYDAQGNFLGFFGSNTVEMQISLLWKRFTRLFMTREQLEKQWRNIPVEFSNFDLDANGFVYTCSSGLLTDASTNELKKINFAGSNIYRGSRSGTPTAWNSGNFGDVEVAYVNGSRVDTSFVDLSVDSDGFVTGVDTTRGRVFQYDSSANLIFAFGGIGTQAGTFQIPSAVETFENHIYVLDSAKNNLTIFKRTEYGDAVWNAVVKYNRGEYVETIPAWETVLKINSNCEMAYVGMGKAYYQLGEYETALGFFEQGNDTEGRSMAFAAYRSVWIGQNFGWLLLALIALCVGLPVTVSILRHRKRRG